MEPKGPPWKTEEGRRAHFVYAFNMQNASDEEIDQAMENLNGYLKTVFEICQDYAARGELHVLEKLAREADEKKYRALLEQWSIWRKDYYETWFLGDFEGKVPDWWDGVLL